jgi:MFS family permease
VKKNIPLLYGFSFFDQFMIVIALWVPYLATQGIGMRRFMELQAVFAIVILSGEVPSGLLSDLWGRKKTLLLGSTLKAVSFSLLPLWSSYEGLLLYHLTMGIALSMISGGDVASSMTRISRRVARSPGQRPSSETPSSRRRRGRR